MSMNIRRAGPSDASRVAALISLAYQVEEFFVEGDRTDVDDVLNRMQRGEFLLMEDEEGSLAGCVYVVALGETGYFGMLSIDPARQRQGLGKQLVDIAEKWCLDAGCREVEIEVVNLRTELPPFYTGLGYIEQGVRSFPDEERCKLPCHFVVMSKRVQL